MRDPEFLKRANAQLKHVETGFSTLIDEISDPEKNPASREQDGQQDRAILHRHKDLLNKAHSKYSDKRQAVDNLQSPPKPSGGIAPSVGGNGDSDAKTTSVTCSLIDEIENIDDLRKAIPGLRSAGHVLFIPEFGTVALGEIEVESNSDSNDNYFTLRMLDMDLGCVGDGKVITALAAANGRHNP